MMQGKEIAEILQRASEEGSRITLTIEPSPKLISGPEAEILLGVSDDTLKRYRQDFWVEGAHYFSQKNGRPKYSRQLLEHWQMFSASAPSMHDDEVKRHLRMNQRQN